MIKSARNRRRPYIRRILFVFWCCAYLWSRVQCDQMMESKVALFPKVAQKVATLDFT